MKAHYNVENCGLDSYPESERQLASSSWVYACQSLSVNKHFFN